MPKPSSPDYSQPKTPDDIIAVLRAIAESNCIIIGGQAVNIWSMMLGNEREEPWASQQPFTSIDADGLGDLNSLVNLATALQGEGYAVELDEAKPPDQTRINTGQILVTSPQLNISINIIHNPIGLRAPEIIQTAQSIKFRKLTLKVLHPLLCVESKAVCLVELRQDNPKEPRQDKKHLILAMANLNVFLKNLGDHNPAGAIYFADRVRGLAVDQYGIRILRQHKIDVLDAVPWQEWGQSPNTVLSDFAKTYAEVVKDRTAAIDHERKAREWIERLKSAAPSRPGKAQRGQKSRRSSHQK